MAYSKEEKARYNAEYYERNKKLKGRQTSRGTGTRNLGRRPESDYSTGNLPTRHPAPPTKPAKPKDPEKALVARIKRLEGKISTLNKALSEATAALSAARQEERKKARESSDGKSTAKEKKESREYRDKHEAELKSKAKKSTSSSGGSSSSSSSSSSKSVSEMNSEELGSRIIKIQSALKDARSQLSKAKQKLGPLVHSAITSDPNVNVHFARFRSERTPSK